MSSPSSGNSAQLPRRCIVAALLFLLVLAIPQFGQAQTVISAARVWPAPEFTRVTLEAQSPIKYRYFILPGPTRLALDLEGVWTSPGLDGIADKVQGNDPYIKLIRAGRFKPNVLRVVFELKTDIKPNVFLLPPAGDYGYRLVTDLYSATPIDPLMLLLAKHEIKAETEEAEAVASNPAAGPPPGATSDKKPGSAPNPAPNGEMRPQNPSAAETGAMVTARKKPQVVRMVTIAIDAGHGGEDPGARGRAGNFEKDVTLAIARKLKVKIDAEPTMRAVLIRDGDYFIPLAHRVNKARRIQADLFVSIHADSFIRPHARGSSVFALSERGATSTAARWLADQENASDLIGGVNLKSKDPYLARTLLDLSQTATISDSLKLGKTVLSQLGELNTLHKRSVEQAGFAVLKAPDIPSILVETAFISNPEEEKRLCDDAYQNRIADSVVSGFKRYLASNPSLAKSRLAFYEATDIGGSGRP